MEYKSLYACFGEIDSVVAPDHNASFMGSSTLTKDVLAYERLNSAPGSRGSADPPSQQGLRFNSVSYTPTSTPHRPHERTGY